VSASPGAEQRASNSIVLALSPFYFTLAQPGLRSVQRDCFALSHLRALKYIFPRTHTHGNRYVDGAESADDVMPAAVQRVMTKVGVVPLLGVYRHSPTLPPPPRQQQHMIITHTLVFAHPPTHAHPSWLAGNGIEYDWGLSKKLYRKKRLNNAGRKTHDHVIADIKSSFREISDLTIRKFMRRTRRYLWAYQQPEATTFSLIEKFVKLHRNILDQESALLDAEMKAMEQRVASERAAIDLEFAQFLKFEKEFRSS
jgi:hypothetical protein